MAAIEGKWKLRSSTNIAEFHDAIKTPEPFKSDLLGMKAAGKNDPDNYLEEVEVDLKENKVVRRIFVKGEKRFDKGFEVGKKNDILGPDGRTTKGQCEIVGDNKITFSSKVEDVEIHGQMEATEDKTMTMTITGNGVTVTEIFTKSI